MVTLPDTRARIRVLIVDDAAVVRRVVTEALERDSALHVIAAARDGQEGLERLSLRPDVVVLDVEMPRLDGLGALRELRRLEPELPVIMFSSLTAKGAFVTMQALALGANDYVLKPSAQPGAADASFSELVAKIKLHHGARQRSRSRATATQKPRLRPSTGATPELIVLGCSTGGPLALSQLLLRLGTAFRVPILVVQHMPNAMFTEALSKSLSSVSKLPVLHAKGAARVRAGEIWIAPGGQHLMVQRGIEGPLLKLTNDPPANACRPAVDVLFQSAARAYGPGVLGVVLTGMGKDGLAGSQAITAARGDVVVQDEASSIVWGMPGAVAGAGLASAVLPLDEIAGELDARARAHRPCVSPR